MILLTGAMIIDGTGFGPKKGEAVLIKESRIVGTGPEPSLHLPEEGVVRMDLSGMTLLPGFIDCHVHILWNPSPGYEPYRGPFEAGWNILQGAHSARQTLEAGFTTVRDLMAPNEQIFPLRDGIEKGLIEGTRIMAAGRCVTISGGHGTQFGRGEATEADGPHEVLKAVRKQIQAGADVIKMVVTRPAFTAPFRGREAYQVDEMRPGVEEAHRAGIPVSAHAHSSLPGIRNAVLAGVDSVEHGAPGDDEVLSMMAKRGTFLVPTLSVSRALTASIEEGTFNLDPGAIEPVRNQHEFTPKTVARASELGVKIALGTDAGMTGVFHGSNSMEFELLVGCGLSPLEAITAGTGNAARNLGRGADLGTIEKGKIADLVVVDGDPTADISILNQKNHIKLVMKEGQIVVDRSRPAN